MATSTITKSNDFRGVDGTRYETLTVSNGGFTPTKDGWVRVQAHFTGTSSDYPPEVSIFQNGGWIAYGLGITYSNSSLIVAAPVKAGLTYTISAYRCVLDNVVLFY